MRELIGTGIAIITPFYENGEVDYDSLEKLINYNIDNGLNYVVVQGTTGESVTLSNQEKIDILEFIKDKVNDRIPIVLGIGGNNTADVINQFDKFDLNGVSAILSASPSYNKPTQEGIYQHYKKVSEKSPLPIILYNVPGRTSSNMTAETTVRLAKDFANIVAIKEASGNLVQVTEIIKDKPNDFLVISGVDELNVPIMSLGGDGIISVAAQAFPKEFVKIIDMCLNDDCRLAIKDHLKFYHFINELFVEG
ncbi:MAG: 4-hydroxy-tetrahydrodipicolinate synthase, partial [Flavobacteriales bacterium]|nr:4-hydroxy-tetrahydrodipicolinate synthase [Flavobacteriales bacterium]